MLNHWDLHSNPHTTKERESMNTEQKLKACKEALLKCQELLDNSDVRYYVSNELGEQAKLHRALNETAKALTLVN